MAKRVRAIVDQQEIFNGFFGPEVVLVPAPGSAPLVQGGLWTPKVIADYLVHQGLANRVEPLLSRQTAVQKSSYAPPGRRPTVNDHIGSIDVQRKVLFNCSHLILIDDVVTKGRTLYACYERLKAAYPDIKILAFAPIRTQGLVPEIEVFVEPYVGTIIFDGDDVKRL